jgi:hypothetical protein
MMRLARRVSLLVAFSLLVSAATAHAECAWVLWSDVSTGSPGMASAREWEIASTSPSQKSCQALMRQQMEARVAQGSGVRILEPDTVVSSVDTLTILRRYLCLPDTVDTRGPKGK